MPENDFNDLLSRLAEAAQMNPEQQTQTEKRCAFCRNQQPEIFSETGNFGLCMDCVHLFYPQINTFEAKKYHTPIEECCVPLTAPDACKICGIRRAQIHGQEGNFCLVCAKKQKMPKADIIANRIGISPEQLEAFAQAVSLSDVQIQKPQPAEDSGRLKVVERCTVDGKQVLFVADTKTGVQYLADTQLKHFSPVLDTDGRPLCIPSGEES